MPVVVAETRGNYKTLFELPITVDGLTVTVGAGSFRVSGTDYVFDEDLKFSATPSAEEDLWIFGWLVEDTQTGKATLLVDELEPDETMFDFEGSPYRLLLQLFKFKLPAKAKSLDDVEVRVTLVSKPPAIVGLPRE